MALIHFLLVYDRRAQTLIEQRQFGDGREAAEAYTELEEKHRDNPMLEIVLVGADSLETIMETHGHYFEATATKSPYLVGIRG